MEPFAIGVDLGGSNLRVGAFRRDGRELASVSLPTDVSAGPSIVLDRMCEAVSSLHANVEGHRDFVGVGIGSPGPLELPAGILHQPPNLPGWDSLNLSKEISRRLSWPVWVDSDANLAALAEARTGAGRTLGLDSLCMITLGTGVGGGIVLNGRTWQGMRGAAGEVGHGALILNGPPCGCGARGCLETYASATGICRRAGQLGLGPDNCPDAAAVAALAETGDPAALTVFEEAGYALGLTLANLINALNLPLYLLGGGVSAAWDIFAPRMFCTIEEFSYVYRMCRPVRAGVYEPGKTHVGRAQLGANSGLLGAAMLPFLARNG